MYDDWQLQHFLLPHVLSDQDFGWVGLGEGALLQLVPD